MNEEYDLQVLLELREKEKDQAEQDYADAVAELNRRESYLENKKDELEQAIEKREGEKQRFSDKRDAGNASPAELAHYRGYIKGLKQDESRISDEIERARQSVEDQRERVEEVRDALSEATKELKAVERHREDWEEEQEQIAKRRKSSAMDDVAARIWRENNS